jgi:hypothetical protein
MRGLGLARQALARRLKGLSKAVLSIGVARYWPTIAKIASRGIDTIRAPADHPTDEPLLDLGDRVRPGSGRLLCCPVPHHVELEGIAASSLAGHGLVTPTHCTPSTTQRQTVTTVAKQISIKTKYELWVTPSERTEMGEVIADC